MENKTSGWKYIIEILETNKKDEKDFNLLLMEEELQPWRKIRKLLHN